MILAIVLAVVASHLIGWFWYSKAGFGKKWMALSGMTEEKMAQMNAKGNTAAKSMTISVVLGLVTASILYVLIEKYGLRFGCVLGAWLALAFPVYAHSALWDDKGWKLVFLNAAQGLVSTAAMAGVIYWFLLM